MKILLIDDNPRRYKKLLENLERNGIDRKEIDLVSSTHEARKLLSANSYGLMIIDIIIPLRVEDEPSEKNSKDLLEELIHTDNLIKPSIILGLSACAVAKEKISSFFQDQLWTIIPYSDEDDTWVKSVINCIEFSSNFSSSAREYKADIAIVCALQDPELSAVLSLPWNWSASRPVDRITFVHEGWFKIGDRKITVVASASPRMGMVAASILTCKLINLFKSDFVIMPGICAGVRSKTGFGDVVAIDRCWDYQSGKRVEDESSGFLMSPHPIEISPEVRSRLEQLKNDRAEIGKIEQGWAAGAPNSLKLVIGPAASGSAVLADSSSMEEVIRQHRELCGVEMEAYGVYSAAMYFSDSRPQVLALKSVCDFGDGEKDNAHQKYAAYTSANIMKSFLERYAIDFLPKI